jgi:hypothetical protein
MTHIFMKGPIHKMLPYRDSITKALGHNEPFVHPKWDLKSSLIYIIRVPVHLVVCIEAIKELIEFSLSYVMEDLVLVREWNMVFDSILIESMVIVDNSRHHGGLYEVYYQGVNCRGSVAVKVSSLGV